ncbi:MAG: hypothetical protein L3J39_14550 [Verrucomicrobiales bacterium]|nr:hypothetical protein [Verrucomicrobiales bacterium]
MRIDHYQNKSLAVALVMTAALLGFLSKGAFAWVVIGKDEPQPSTMACSKSEIRKVYGKIQWVDAFPDYKVKVVGANPDLKVKRVDAFPTAPGKWKIVNSFPDYKIQIVDAFPDFTIQYVDAFPGLP